MKLTVNEQPVEVAEAVSLLSVRDRLKPGADVLILNGAAVGGEELLHDGDRVTLIRRGEVPCAEEMEALMVARHTPGVHAKLKEATVGLAGLGGLGSSIAIALARSGIGRLIVADFDVVEPSNLNRQQYFTDQIGQLKADALVANLRRIHPYSIVEAHAVRVTPENISTLFGNVDVMIEAFDQPDQKAMLLDTFTALRPDCPFIGASGLAGYGNTEALRIHRIAGQVYIVGDLSTAARPGCGLMAPRVGVAAHLQADLAVSLLVDAQNNIEKEDSGGCRPVIG